MGKRSIKKNYLYNLMYQVLLLITPLVMTPYVSRVLGADGVGTVSYTESIVAYFVLFANMGITTYGQREISYVQDSRKKRSVVFWNTKILQSITAFLSLLVYLFFSMYQDDVIIYAIFSINILAVLVDVTWFYQGMEEFGKIVLRNMVFKILNIIYIFVFVKTREDIYFYALGMCLFTMVSNLILWFSLRNYIDKVGKNDLHLTKELPIVLSLFAPTIAIQIYTVLDKTMIGVITQDAYQNGYYEQALKISRMGLMVVTALGTVMIPRIGYYFEQKEKEKIEMLMYRTYRFVWFLGIPLCLGLMMVASNFVPWFFGAGYDQVVVLIRILSCLILAIGINNVTGMQYLIPTKKQNIFTITVVIGATINFILNAILINKFQAVGAAVSSVVAEAVIAIVQLIIVRKELNPWLVINGSKNYWLAGGVMAFTLYYVGSLCTASMLHTFLLILVGGAIYLVLLLLLKDEFLCLYINGIREKVKKH